MIRPSQASASQVIGRRGRLFARSSVRRVLVSDEVEPAGQVSAADFEGFGGLRRDAAPTR